MIIEILFWGAVVVCSFIALRHLLSALAGIDRGGETKKGQRLCHVISCVMISIGVLVGIIFHSFIPIIAGIILEKVIRWDIIKSGNIKQI